MAKDVHVPTPNVRGRHCFPWFWFPAARLKKRKRSLLQVRRTSIYSGLSTKGIKPRRFVKTSVSGAWLEQKKASKQPEHIKSQILMTASEENWSVLWDVRMETGRWGRRASQKDHLSCVRGSVEREGDSEGVWLLLSSPFKLILHTGHVSCCSATEQNAHVSFLQNSHIFTNISRMKIKYSKPRSRHRKLIK